jgi:hypothetical protein
MRNLRKRCSHPNVRSTSERHRPSLSRDSTPYRAIRAAILADAVKRDVLWKRTLDRRAAYLDVCEHSLKAL